MGFLVANLPLEPVWVRNEFLYNFKKGLNGTPYRLASEITGAHNKLIGNLLDFGVARSRTDF